MAIPYIGKCFSTAAEFLDYLDDIKFGAWRPKFVTMHHTGGPDLKTWRGWQTRAKPVTDERWMSNLATYYGSAPPNGPGDGPWSSGPHFFFTPSHFCVLSLPDKRGVHAKSFNAISWGVECVGNFDSEPFDGAVRDKYVEGLACLHIATGLQVDPFVRGVSGLHFHRDDPKTTKTCPGTKVLKPTVVKLVQEKIAQLTGGSHVEEVITPVSPKKERIGTVNVDELNVRAAASAKAPLLDILNKGQKVTVIGEASNDGTLWYSIPGGFVAGRYVTIDG